ncbi:MAG: Co2+/Mg2+ efflux protein ApaG [Phycisphaerae bacterium]|nr:Co2+/Mg2+ efflux protein ApaG [Phycisphaerae bacterium]
MGRPAPSTTGSVTLTHGFRVAASPQYLNDQSAPDAGKYVFGYRIRITNESERAARLLWRRWRIVDADGHERVVEGEGVVGVQPEIPPGESYSYTSYCPLSTAWGTMEGVYTMARLDEPDERFEIEIGRFFLIAPDRDE